MVLAQGLTQKWTALNNDPKGVRKESSTTITDENQLKVDTLIREDSRLKIREIALLTGIPKSSVHEIVSESGY
ncbi:hypothetical protein Trydic_g17160 [Trypoxylus dichotomus]